MVVKIRAKKFMRKDGARWSHARILIHMDYPNPFKAGVITYQRRGTRTILWKGPPYVD